MSAIARTPSSSGAVTDPIRVMVVDDSVVIRGLLGRWLDEEPNLAVVASHRNGRLAVDDVLRSNPDVVILDIEMPDMDGLTALPLLIEKPVGVSGAALHFQPDSGALVAEHGFQGDAHAGDSASTVGGTNRE